ncbi:MAG: uroporphyrinogen-III C-methyltransferase [Pirellulaceae bacterium]|nr:uroporphyrinogen-III C-methyltransferase [Pirellulaceae bacterium]
MNCSNSRLGRVFLVGAGPGDPGLMTIRGAQKLGEADVILHDGLANPALRSLTRHDAEWISVGKHGCDRIWTQPEIDAAIVHHARLGKTIVRLKGGDTGVFARTAEELERLIREGIPFEVVPGITAGLAAAAYTGIPITHRDWSSAVALVTGQFQASDGGPEFGEPVDWAALAKFPGTLVIYMGVTTASIWSQRLMNAGLSPDTAVALVRRCSWPDQETIRCTLEQVADQLTPASNFRPPVIAIVGPVAHLGTQSDWFTKRPLFGRSVLFTRPASQAADTLGRLADLGANVVSQSCIEILPLTHFEALDARISQLSRYDWLVFTSANGVDHFFARLHALKFDGRELHRCRIAAVGPSVTAALDRWKLRADLTPNGDVEKFNAEALAERLIQEIFVQGNHFNVRCLVVRTERGKPTIEVTLGEHGISVESVVVYQSVDVAELDPETLKLLHLGEIDYAFVTSTSIALNLAKLAGEFLGKTKLIAISADVAGTLENLGFSVFGISRQSSIDSMIDWLVENEA